MLVESSPTNGSRVFLRTAFLQEAVLKGHEAAGVLQGCNMSKNIGRFEILGELSHSVLGCVYKAQDVSSGQVLALKTVKLDAANPESAELVRLALVEAENTKTLNSHNIALLYGAGEIEGKFCGSMEYVQGNSVATMLTRGEAFSVWDLQDIARQACQGLDHAHARHVVHYSLEPAKLMVQWDGTVKILGFGISGLSLHEALLAEKSAVLNYMSPEQVRGEPMDGRSNLFSMACILYEMATGRKAFDGDDAEKVKQQILDATPPYPSEINGRIHPALSDVIMKALCKAPDERYASGQELAKAIENHRAGEAAAAPGKLPGPLSAGAEKVEPPRAAAAASGPSDQLMGFGEPVQAAASAAAAPRPVAQTPARSAASISVGSGAAARMAPAGAEAPTEAGLKPGAKPKSFSEISELPPLAEVHVQSAPPEPAPDPLQELREPHYHGPQRAAEQQKTPPAEVAKKAVEEIRKTPPKLFLYSIGAALAIILVVLLAIISHVHSQNAIDDGSAARPAKAASGAASSAAAPVSGSASVSAAHTTPARADEDSDKAYISIKPKVVRHREVKPSAPVAVLVPGEVTVNSVPEGAHVLVDGQGDPSWTTPRDVSGLMPGAHTITLSKDGFSTETRSVQIASRSKLSVSVVLAQLAATVLVTGDPPGSQILLDGRDTGRVTPSQLSIAGSGNHTVLVRKQGYLDESTTLNTQPGQALRYAPTLRQLGMTDDIKTASKLKFFGGKPEGTGEVTVKTQPKGAQIAVNRRILDKNSPAEFYLNPGTYVIDITLTGYKSVQRIVHVDKGEKVQVDETLDRQ